MFRGGGDGFHGGGFEEFLVHARIVLEFLTNSSRCKDDVIPDDFDFPAQELVGVEELATRINKDMAHITYSRLERRGPDKIWKLKPFLDCILTPSANFIGHMASGEVAFIPEDERLEWSCLLEVIESVRTFVQE